jgi:Transglutaminase-like superfamily
LSLPRSGHRHPPLHTLVRLASIAVLTPLLVRAGLPALARWLEPRRPPVPVPRDDEEELLACTGRWVDGIIRRGRPLVRAGCLTRGVTGYDALRRSGLDVSLCFGMGVVDGSLEGHCWLEWEGRAPFEPADPRAVFAEVARSSQKGVTGSGPAADRTVEWV